MVAEISEIARLADDRYETELAVRERSDKGHTKSASTVLVELALKEYTFGVSTLGETFAVPKQGSKVVSMLRGNKRSLRALLARTYFTKFRRVAAQQALADALMVIDGFAQESEATELFLRVAGHAGHAGNKYGPDQGEIWLDLADETGRAIKIRATGWAVEDQPPMLFKRTALMSALPEPSESGSLDELWAWFNVSEADRPILSAWLVAAMFHDIPHPILAFFGEQGTGKTTAQKLIVSTIDPGPVPTRKPPRDADSWITAAAGSWLVGLDNLSTIPAWLSDSLCRAVSGDGDVRRRLYTDSDHAVFAFRRVLCLNSIDLGAVRGDLAERMLPITLAPIKDHDRLLESELWPRWHEAHPRILAGILDLAAGVLKHCPLVKLTSKPRMSDFAHILAAVDMVLGTSGLRHYLGKQSSLAADSLDGDLFIMKIAELGYFQGTAAELLRLSTPEKPPRYWPANPRAVTQRLRRQAPVMRKAGWGITDDGGANHRKIAIWSIQPPEITRNLDPLDPQARMNAARNARVPVKEAIDSGRAGADEVGYV